jgi:hypothetical protein
MCPVSAVDAAWNLLKAGSGHRDEAAELALGLVRDPAATPDEVARAGSILLEVRRYPDALQARDRALAGGAAPVLLAYLDASCHLVVHRDCGAARRALAEHLAAVPDPLQPELVGLAVDAGAPALTWRAAGRAGLGVRERVGVTARAAIRRAPRRSRLLRAPAR